MQFPALDKTNKEKDKGPVSLYAPFTNNGMTTSSGAINNKNIPRSIYNLGIRSLYFNFS